MRKQLYHPRIIQWLGYGALYNWWSANDVNFAPIGCRLPTDTELATKVTYLGGSTVAGGHLKEIGITHWLEEHADNSSGFSLFGGGCRLFTGSFILLQNQGFIWSSVDFFVDYAYYLSCVYSGTISTIGYNDKKNGYSVRFILDDPDSWYEGMTVTDYDGNVYQTVKIGGQVWTASNFKCEHYNNGDPITIVTDTTTWADAYENEYMCYYNNDKSNA